MGSLRLQRPINNRGLESFHIRWGSLAKSKVCSGEFKQRIYHLGYMTPSILSGTEEIEEVLGWADTEETPGTSPKATVQKWPPRHCRVVIIRKPPAISAGSPRVQLCPPQHEACVAPCSPPTSVWSFFVIRFALRETNLFLILLPMKGALFRQHFQLYPWPELGWFVVVSLSSVDTHSVFVTLVQLAVKVAF